MPTHRLHNWTFSLWDGPSPSGVRAHVGTHSRPGVNGLTHTLLGTWGDPFQAQITEYYASFALACDARRNLVEPLPAAGLVRLWWNSIDFLARYQTVFQVTEVADLDVRTVVRVVNSAGVNWPNAGVLRARLTLVPHQGT